MSRGTPVLPARSGHLAEGTAAAQHQRPRREWARRGWVRRVLEGVGDSCAFACAGLLACLALVAVGALGSLVWALVVER
jgi:hypothetical protein